MEYKPLSKEYTKRAIILGAAIGAFVGLFSGAIIFVAAAAVIGAVLGGVFAGAPTRKAAETDFQYQQAIEKQKDAIEKEHEMHVDEHLYHENPEVQSTAFRDSVTASRAAPGQTRGR